jgi:hypothetical protein
MLYPAGELCERLVSVEPDYATIRTDAREVIDVMPDIRGIKSIT